MKESNVVAVVNGKEITKDNVLQFLNAIGPQMAMQFQSPDGIKRVIDELVNQELLYLDAVELEYDKDKEFNDILEQTKTNLLKDYAVNKLIRDITADEEEYEEYFNSNKNLFEKEETAVASHILVDSEEKANEIISEINEGLDFAEAASKYSSCPSKEAGGSLGEFGKGQMVKEFEDKVFSMNEGEISEPVQTQFGYHIIKLDNLNSPTESTYDEVKEQVQKQLLLQKQQYAYLQKIDALKGRYKVTMM